MNGFQSPNHTQTPNDLFDSYMAIMGESELKVTLAIIRKTLGYHKTKDAISLTQLQKMTGLSRQGASDGATAAIARGLVEVVGTGKRGVLIYGLVIGIDQSTLFTSQGNDQSTTLDSTGTQSRHTKENRQKKKEKKESARKPKWVNEDALIDVWASIRKLDAIAMGADYHTDSDRRLIKKMLGWPKPLTADEIREVMKRSKHTAYPISFIEKDVLALRAEKPAAIHPSHVPFAPVEVVPDAVPMPDEARAAMQSLTKSVHVNDEVIHAELAKSA